MNTSTLTCGAGTINNLIKFKFKIIAALRDRTMRVFCHINWPGNLMFVRFVGGTQSLLDYLFLLPLNFDGEYHGGITFSLKSPGPAVAYNNQYDGSITLWNQPSSDDFFQTLLNMIFANP